MKKEKIPQYIILVLAIIILIQNHSLSNDLHNKLLEAQSDLKITRADAKRTEKLLNKMQRILAKQEKNATENE